MYDVQTKRDLQKKLPSFNQPANLNSIRQMSNIVYCLKYDKETLKRKRKNGSVLKTTKGQKSAGCGTGLGPK